MKKNTIKARKVRRLFLLSVFPLCQLFIIISIYWLNSIQQAIWNVFGAVGLLLGVSAELYLCHIFRKNEEQEKIAHEIQKITYDSMLEKLHRKESEEQQREFLELKSEMKKVVSRIREDLEKENVKEILDFLKQDMEFGRKNYCGNSIVNAVLEEKEAECNRNRITLLIDVRMGEIPNIAKSHLCSIFTNLLDNAIAAVLETCESKREIWISAGLKAEYLIVKAANRSTISYAERKPAANHGMGKQILADIAETYEGYYEAAFKDGYYYATVIVKAESGGGGNKCSTFNTGHCGWQEVS